MCTIRQMENCENPMVIGDYYPEEPKTYCPICGDECETVYINIFREPVGCDACIRTMDVEMWWADNKE